MINKQIEHFLNHRWGMSPDETLRTDGMMLCHNTDLIAEWRGDNLFVELVYDRSSVDIYQTLFSYLAGNSSINWFGMYKV